MQAIGRPCALCEERIAWAHEGVGCAACDAAYHLACLERETGTAERCPRCHRSFADLEREAEASRRVAEHAEKRRRWRWQTLGFLLLAVVLLGAAWAIVGSSTGGGTPLSRPAWVLVRCLVVVGMAALIRFAWEALRLLRDQDPR